MWNDILDIGIKNFLIILIIKILEFWNLNIINEMIDLRLRFVMNI